MVNSFRRNIRLGLGVSLIALIVSSAASYLSIAKLLESDKQVDHTFRVIQDFNNLLSRMKDAETGQRGYLLTGDPVFLEPYTGSKNEVSDLMDHVQILTSDNDVQQKDFPVLEDLVKQKYDLIDATISERNRGIQVTTEKMLAGKTVMDSIRKQVRLMEGREKSLLDSRLAKVNKFAIYTPILILIASIVALWVTYASYRRMKQNLHDTQRLQELLEQKEEQTAQSIQAIGNLADQISKGRYYIRIKETDLNESGGTDENQRTE